MVFGVFFDPNDAESLDKSLLFDFVTKVKRSSFHGNSL